MSLFSDMSRFQKFKWIYIGVYFVLNLIVLIISYRISHNFGKSFDELFDMQAKVPNMWYFPLVGMLMFLGLILIYTIEIRQLKGAVSKKEKDMHLLKSKLYDIEKSAQVSSAEVKKGQQGN
ncbi:MAG TPA: hypothetical protein VI583_05585 [Cyclobacteriaceae bacterium]|nr:hypothetical protein [Cyclobacteriaceae bacterium]